MSQPSFHIRRGEPRDAIALAQFAARTFSDTFAAANRPEDMAAYLPSAYGVNYQASELTNPDIVTLLMETDSGALAAYAMLRRGSAPDCVTGGGQSPVELWRFYVDKPWHGFGVAHRLMSEVEQTARELGAHVLWLGVWEKNERAIAFYNKRGYRDVGAQDFWVGADRQTDRVMVRRVFA